MRLSKRSIALYVALAPFVGSGSAHAEFRLIGPAVSAVPAREPHADPRAPPSQPAGPAVAYGFGTQVPLAFAARQIVPHGVKVAFGDGVDPEVLLVNWTGGRPWPDVLRTMLRPASLQVTFSPGALLIALSSTP
jgi:hypothetical protein